MAEKKVTPKKTLRKKEEKLSPEEIKKKREEVLRRLNEELGESAAVEETVTEVEIVDIPDQEKEDSNDIEEENADELSEKVEKRRDLMEQEIISEDKEMNEEPSDEEAKDEIKKKERTPKEEIEEVGEDSKEEKHDEMKSAEREESSPFSAAEFGLADRSSNKTKNLILFLVIFVLVVIISAVFYFYFRSSLANIVEEKPETTITPTEAPTATPEPVAFERGEISVQILNGSGTAGVAGTMQEFLEGEGYENIEVGNAEEFDYENVTIQLKKEFEDYFDEISSDIEKEYTVNEEFDILEEDSEYDMVVIVGTASEEDTEAPLSDE